MNTTVEILDLVDENDQVFDTLPRDEIYANDLKHIRVIELFIRNKDGKLWIPIRGLHKRIAPGGFDVGAGGHVEHGESYEEALRKEVGEVLFWNIDEFKVVQLGKYGPKDGLNTVSMVCEIETGLEPTLNPEDFTSAEWITPSDLAIEITEGHPAKSNLLPLLKLVYKV